MNNSAVGRRLYSVSRVITFQAIWMLAAATVGLLFIAPARDSSQIALVRTLSESRVGGGRFFRADTSFETARYKHALSKAELLLVSMPDSGLRQRLRAMIDAGTGRLSQAANVLTRLSDLDPKNPEILNDLGVILLALGEANPSNYFRALSLFERSQQLAPLAAAPRFNSVLAARRAELHDLAAAKLAEYERLEVNPHWTQELRRPEQPTDSELMDKLRQVLT